MQKLRYIFLLLCCLPFASCQNPSKNDQPNVVLIVVDDLGWKDLGFMGSEYYETPNLDLLAKESKVFMNAYASAANCAPSRANMISGMNSPHHGVYTVANSDRGKIQTRKLIPTTNTVHLSIDEFTLHDMFKSKAYITSNFGKWHVGNDPKLQGVDVNVGGSHRGGPGPNGYFAPYNLDNIQDGPEGEYLTERLTNEAITFVNENADKPFFLYLPFYTIHTPILAKQELIEKFEAKEGSNGQSNPTYAAMVYAMDQNIGKLMASIKSHGLEENTMFIITSDNGGIRALSSQEPLRAGKGSYYEGGIRVPLLVKWKGRITPGINAERVTNLDFFPTIQTIIDGSSGKSLAGADLSDLLFQDDHEMVERDLFWHFPIYLQAYKPYSDDGRDPLFRTRPGSVMISGDWKIHEYFEDGAFELYHLVDDPGERKDLAEIEVSKLEEMKTKLLAWRSRHNAPVPQDLNDEYDSEFEQSYLRSFEAK